MSSKRRWTKPSKNLANEQMSLLGDIYKHTIKYQPIVSTSEDGLSVVVLRLPPIATDNERVESYQEMHRLAASISKGTVSNRWYSSRRAKAKELRLRLLQNDNVRDNIRDKKEVA